jgi:two-component system sensor histidine kinase MprB
MRIRQRIASMSLRNRIAAVAGLAVAVVVIGAAVAVYFAVRTELRGEVDSALRDRASPLAGVGPGGGPRPDGGALDAPPGAAAGGASGPTGRTGRGGAFGPALPDVDNVPGGYGAQVQAPPEERTQARRFGGAAGFIQLVTPSGSVRRPDGGSGSLRLPVDKGTRAIARLGTGEQLRDFHVNGVHLRVLTRGAGAAGGAIQVARPLNEVDDVLRRVLLILLIIVVAGSALAVGLGTIVARSALAPIGRFTRRTETVAASLGLSERMEVEGTDELARLATSFNTTLDALERSVEAQRHLVADASHELRTPIASLRANVQVLEDADRLPPEELAALRADIVSELDELTEIVAGVVELARGRAKASEVLDDVRLDLIVESLADRAARRAADKVSFDLRLEPTVIAGEPERINRAVSNVIDNARKWSPEGGKVEIDLSGGRLRVRDHGPGFAASDLPHVFERFYRSEAARAMPGSGLGLAMVRQAAEEAGGSAEAANAPGGGAVVTVSFGASNGDVAASADQPGS